MSSIRLGTLDPGDGDPLDPEERRGQTVPETVVQATPGQAVPPPGPTVGPDGKWDAGYIMPIPPPGRGPVSTYDEDRDYDGLPADSQKAALTVAHTDAEKEANFNSLRSMFGLGPDSAAKAQPHPVSPDANAPQDSDEFKAWLRQAPHDEFQKWMDGQGGAGLSASAVQPTPAMPAPTEVAVAQARAALGPPMSATEMSQRAAQMPSAPPPRPAPVAAPLPADPMQAAAVSDARRYQAAAGPLNPYEQALMLKELANKYAVKEPEKSYYPSQEQVAHANERARGGGAYGALTPAENAEMIKKLMEKYRTQGPAERAYNALPGGSLEQFKETAAQRGAPVATARTGVGAAYPPTMVNDLAGRGWKVTPQGFDEGAPIVSPEEQARQIGELLKKQTPEQAKAARDKAFLDALNGR